MNFKLGWRRYWLSIALGVCDVIKKMKRQFSEITSMATTQKMNGVNNLQALNALDQRRLKNVIFDNAV
jgi:hypothetical protein